MDLMDRVRALKGTKLAPGVSLPQALLDAASRRGGNQFIFQYAGVEGWHVWSGYLPPASSFFKVRVGQGEVVFYACQTKGGNAKRGDYHQVRAGLIKDGKIIQDGNNQ